MSGESSAPMPTSRKLELVTVVVSTATILGSVLLRVFTLPLGIVCLGLGIAAFRAARREDPTIQGPARGAVAMGATAFLVGIGWLVITILMATLEPMN